MSQYDEIKLVRRVHSGLPSLLDSFPESITPSSSSELSQSTITPKIHSSFKAKDLTNITHTCMLNAYNNLFLPNISELLTQTNKQNKIFSTYLHSVFSCWSGAALYNNPGKSIDITGRCPFHWNHLSCVDWKEKNSPSWRNKQRYFIPFQHKFIMNLIKL